MRKIILTVLLASLVTTLLNANNYSLAHESAMDTSIVTKAGDTLTMLQAHQEHYNEAYILAAILNQHHYSKTPLDDSISARIFDSYLDNFDHYHIYFLEEDIKEFEKYKYHLDDLLLKGNVDFAFEVFNTFKKRFSYRVNDIPKTLEIGFDYSIDEYIETEENVNSWATSYNDLGEEWRKVLKSQSLSLRLSGEEQEVINESISQKYANYLRAINQYESEDVFQMYMNTLANAYDPHTSYFSPHAAENFEIDMSLSLEGIGARLVSENDFVVFSEIIVNGPADKSGEVFIGDKLLGVAQENDTTFVDVHGWRTDDVVSLLRGPKGTYVSLKVLPANAKSESEYKIFSLMREKVRLEDQAAKGEIIEYTNKNKKHKLGVITIPSFYLNFEAARRGDKDYESTNRDVRNILLGFKKKRVDGVIIDLRRNGGGSLQEAIELTGLFIPQGPVVQVRNADGSVDIGTDPDNDTVYDGPMAVLINRFSASASEIFAGAIQDYKRGVIIGEATYGKGTVQHLIDLSRFLPEEKVELGQIKLTLAKYYRITGSSTQHLGVQPDIELPSAYPAEEYGESSQPNALPWDKIQATQFNEIGKINEKLIESLRETYRQRLKSDAGLIELIDTINELEKEKLNTRISLNETIRKKEIEEAELREENKEFSRMLDTPEVEDLKTNLKIKPRVEDVYLRQGIHLLAQMIESLG
ncbi:carboxy terminal-processing peptidase [Flammeovirgaceae bacterium SG7u.111]|nr:carboxy terminal-processing peptidase [Flammeovirgaceae bacterium SG7u.132]WPO33567.1 carboxy terminal-processing peptidase [Flammeovirgaceae bacterium SG7u.111]